MHYDHDIDLAKNVAKEALARMQADNITPDPNNFEIWYAYYSNSHRELRKAMDALMKTRPITNMDCRNFYDQFLSDHKRQQVYARASDQIHATLDDVSELMKNVKEVTVEYTATLSDATVRIAAVQTPQDMSEIVHDIIADTQKLIEQNKSLETQLEKSAGAMQELKRDMERVQQEAMTDGLTGLANRKAFNEQLDKLVKDSDESGRSFTLLMVDIDHFKSFNDNFGHQVGDQVLRLVARTLTDGIKGRDTATRYGGEEFTILLPDTNLNAGITVAESLRKALANKEIVNRTNGELLGRITMSIGVAQYYQGEDREDLIERADAALYKAKHNGRNQVAAAQTPHDRYMAQ
jgi:diguanylate cyclase